MQQTMSVTQAFKKQGKPRKGERKNPQQLNSGFLAWNICILSHVPDDETNLEARKHTSVSLVHRVQSPF